MRISDLRRGFLAGAILMALSGPLMACTSGDSCIRISDCNDGLTCAAGRCVVPPASTDTGDGGVVDTTLPDGATGTTDATSEIDGAASPYDGAVYDGGTDGSGDDGAADADYDADGV